MSHSDCTFLWQLVEELRALAQERSRTRPGRPLADLPTLEALWEELEDLAGQERPARFAHAR
jgi:hypothetical protein